MASTVAYAPGFDSNNTMAGAQKMQQEVLNAQLMNEYRRQMIDQNNQKLPFELQQIQAETQMKAQQLEEAKATMGDRIDSSHTNLLLAKSSLASNEIRRSYLDKTLQHEDELLNDRVTISRALAKTAEQSNDIDVRSKQAELEGKGFSNQAAKLALSFQPAQYQQKQQMTTAQLDNLREENDQMRAKTMMDRQRVEHESQVANMEFVQHLAAIPTASARAIAVHGVPKTSPLYQFVEHPELLNDENILPMQQLLQNKLIKEAPDLVARHQMGIDPNEGLAPVIDPKTGKATMGFKGQKSSDRLQQILQGAFDQTIDKSKKQQGGIGKIVNQVSTPATPAEAGNKADAVSSYSDVPPEQKPYLDLLQRQDYANSQNKVESRKPYDALNDADGAEQIRHKGLYSVPVAENLRKENEARDEIATWRAQTGDPKSGNSDLKPKGYGGLGQLDDSTLLKYTKAVKSYSTATSQGDLLKYRAAVSGLAKAHNDLGEDGASKVYSTLKATLANSSKKVQEMFTDLGSELGFEGAN